MQTINGGKIIIGSRAGMSHAILCSRAEIKIEDNVLVGSGMKIYDHDILKGVTIGRHSVIGAGAVVTKDILENEVWAGNPVEFIKRLPKEKGKYL